MVGVHASEISRDLRDLPHLRVGEDASLHFSFDFKRFVHGTSKSLFRTLLLLV